jgi:hypothetical protein
MRVRPSAGVGVVMLAVTGAVAHAQLHVGDPILIPTTPQNVSVHYMSASTTLDGVLWLAGSSTRDGLDVPLFFNRSGELGFEHELGRFEANSRLDFIYDVLSAPTDSFRTTNLADAMQYRWRWDTPDIILVEVDDRRLPGGDGDYNDMRFEIRFMPIPGSASGAALTLLTAFGLRRRR